MESQISISRTSDDVIAIEVIDESSGISIYRGEMAMAEFASCLTGLARCKAETIRVIDPADAWKIGKTKITEDRFCEKAKTFDKKDQRLIVVRAFAANDEPDGWILWNDGTGTQQPGQKHRYSVCKYE